MKLRKLLIISGILLFISGCSDFMMICSLHPFYLEKNVTLAPEIEGNWLVNALKTKSDSTNKNSSPWHIADTIQTWSIKRKISQETVKTKLGKDSIVFKPLNYYEVVLDSSNPDSAEYRFKMVVFSINKVLFADFSPLQTLAIKNSRMATENYLTVHTLAKVNFRSKQLFLSWLGTDYVKDMIEKKRVRIKYKYLPDAGRLILTATSEELTAMISRYAFETRFIDWEDQPAMLKLTRKN